ncbi:MAG TPA: IclR family transcriptional regulator C-terminal domain-containing protein [Kiloniellaceae bacterium]
MAEDREFITSLARGLSVIHAFDRDHPQQTLSEVAARTGLSPATARRCLWTLERLGYVAANGRFFMLRPKVVSLGSAFLDSGRIEEVIQPILRDIVAESGDSASLGVLEDKDVLYVANFSARRFVRMTAGVGSRFPAYAVSMGRILLAALPEEQLEQYLATAELAPLTPWTVTNPKALRKLIAKVRRDGYIIVRDELEEGLAAVAVPVRLKSGRTVAALNCSSLTRRLDNDNTLQERAELLQRAAQRVSEAVQMIPSLGASLGLPTEFEAGPSAEPRKKPAVRARR